MTGDNKIRSSICREVTVEVLYVAKFNSESKIVCQAYKNEEHFTTHRNHHKN